MSSVAMRTQSSATVASLRMDRRRIAFLTPEYPTEAPGGGLAAYVRRMAIALKECGHEVEVFVPGGQASGVIVDRGIRVERTVFGGSILAPLMEFGRRVSKRVGLEELTEIVQGAAGLAVALRRREAAHLFDLVQSSDYLVPGLFVTPGRGRVHLVRCSWAADLFQRVDGAMDRRAARIAAWLERRMIKRVDAAYAPSDFVASYYRARFGLNIEVLRPPAVLETEPTVIPRTLLPPRYLVFFGRICRRKGADTLAAALPLAWREAPDLAMVWAGPESEPSVVSRYRERWGDRRSQVTYLGVRSTAVVYAVVRGADAAVVPSIVDNFPNTVIESLLLGVPVIGSRGASIDELVQDEVSGLLVPIGDPPALARAMLRVWHGRTPWRRSEFQVPDRICTLTPARAVSELLTLAHRSGMSAGRAVTA